MMQQSTNYFVSGHTAKGYVNYLHTNLMNVKKVLVLQHDHPQVITKVLLEVGAEQGLEEVEILLSPHGNGMIAGAIFRSQQLAILSEAIIVDPVESAIYLDINPYCEPKHFDMDSHEIKDMYEKSYAYFKKGLDIHDGLENVYIEEMNFKKADEVTAAFIENLLDGVEKKTGHGNVYERLFGTNTLAGMENVVANLLKPLGNRVFIKGRAGTGKSVFMKKVWEACETYGFDIEVYHCSFDPESIDMIIVRELDFCIFDSTDPHEFFPERGKDKVIDLYEATVTAGTDETYAAEITKLTKDYKAQMKLGMETLKKINEYYPLDTVNVDVDDVVQTINHIISSVK